jgi:hypothetical protein
MIIDNNTYLMKIGGRPCDSTAWSSLWAATTNYSASYDLGSTTNRSIAEGGYLVWRQGAAETMTATGTVNVQLVCSAAAALGTDTILWETGVMVHATIIAKMLANTIVWVVKIPRNIPLRYLGVAWVVGTDAMETTTADIFITPDAPYPEK